MSIFIEGVEFVGEGFNVALGDISGADLALEVAVRVVVCRAFRNAVEVVKVGANAFCAVRGSDGTGRTNG